MADRAILLPDGIISMDMDTNGDVTYTINVHYGQGNTEEWKEMSGAADWPGTLTPNSMAVSMRAKIIAEQPDGYDLSNDDIMLPSLIRASLL